MTNVGHFRAAGKLLNEFEGELETRLWIAPPTKMDEKVNFLLFCLRNYFSTVFLKRVSS
jgi:hypothetical protein